MAARATTKPAPGPKPTEPYTVEHNYHHPIEQEDGTLVELVLPLRIGYKRFKGLLAQWADLGPTEQLESLIAEYDLDDAALQGAADYVDVLVAAQAYFEKFQEVAVARLGELQGSSPA